MSKLASSTNPVFERTPANEQEAAGVEAVMQLPPSVRLVVVAGMYRSGSTWLYNAVRLLAQETGKKVYPCWISDFTLERAADAELVIVKIHDMSDALARRAWRILTSHRDLRDVARSAVDMDIVPAEDSVGAFLRDCVVQHAFWAVRAYADIRYEDIGGNAQTLLGDVASAVEMPVSSTVSEKIVHSLDQLKSPVEIGPEGHDVVTLMHVKHRFDGRTGSWKESLAPATVGAINAEFGAWLERYGYDVEVDESTARTATPRVGGSEKPGKARYDDSDAEVMPPDASELLDHLPAHVRLVVVAAMDGDEASWLVHGVHRLIEASGSKTYFCTLETFRPDLAATAEVVVVLLSAPNEQIAFRAWRVIAGHADLRKFEESSGATVSCDPTSDVLQFAAKAVSDHAFWAARAHLDLGYEEIADNPATTVYRLASVIDVEVTPVVISNIVTSLARQGSAAGASGQAGRSPAVPVQSEGVESAKSGLQFNAAGRSRIESAFYSWLEGYGYVPGSGANADDKGGAAVPMDWVRSHQVRVEAETDDRLRSRDILVIVDADSWSDPYRVFSYLSNLRRQLGDGVACRIVLLGRYAGPELRFRDTKIDYRGSGPVIGRRRVQRWLRRVRSLTGTGGPKWWYSTVDKKREGVLESISAHLGGKDLVVLSRDSDFTLFAVRCAAVFGQPGKNRVCAVMPATEAIWSQSRRRISELGARVLFDGSDYESPAGHLMPTGLVFNFDDPEETPLRPRKVAGVNWRYQLAASKMPDRKPEVVLFVRPDWARCGSATTFQTLHDHFAARRAIVVDVALQISSRDGPEARAEKLNAVRSELRPWFHLNFQRAGWHGRLLTVGRKGYIPHTVAGLLPLAYLSCHAEPKAKRWLSRIPFDYSYVNHYFSLLAARDMRPGLPVLLDTHDLQSSNFVEHEYRMPLSGRKSSFTACFEDEMRIVKSADLVTMVSEDERQFMLKAAPELRSFLYIPVPAVKRSHDTISDQRPEEGPVRLLIVASRNPANELSMKWFLDSIWPSLRQSNAKLDVVGGVDSFFENRAIEHVEFHGIVPELDAFYKAADIVVLPITNGGGIAIKTLEALQWGKAVAATSHAMRGLPGDVRNCFSSALDEMSFVTDLKTLIESPDARAERQQGVTRARRMLRSYDFDASLYRYLNDMLAWKYHHPVK